MIPISSRQIKKKTYYVLLSQGGQYKGCYTTVQATSLDKAKMAVIERFGLLNYGGIERDELRAKALIKAFGLKPVEEAREML